MAQNFRLLLNIEEFSIAQTDKEKIIPLKSIERWRICIISHFTRFGCKRDNSINITSRHAKYISIYRTRYKWNHRLNWSFDALICKPFCILAGKPISKINYVWLNKAYGYVEIVFRGCVRWAFFLLCLLVCVSWFASNRTSPLKTIILAASVVIWSDFFFRWFEMDLAWWISLCFVKQILSFAVQSVNLEREREIEKKKSIKS